MTIYKARPGTEVYGYCIGVLSLDSSQICVPGSVGNASTFDFPVIYKTVSGVTADRLKGVAPECEEAVLDSARFLAAQGVRGITSDCELFIRYQQSVRRALNVPVFLSSLLQIQFISKVMGRRRPLAVVVHDARLFDESFPALAEFDREFPLIVRGMEGQPAYQEAFYENGGPVDTDLIEREVVGLVRSIVAENRETGAILLAGSMMPPYARSVHAASGLPVYDYVTMINFFKSVSYQRPTVGYL